MAIKKRMISPDVVDTDLFQEMPQSTRLLYYELCIRADDDGFIGNIRKIINSTGCSEDDVKILATKNYITLFNSGVIVITHWLIHNRIRKDRYHETIYQEERKQLILESNCSYILCHTTGMTSGEPVVYLEKKREEKNRVVEENSNYTSDYIISERNGNGDENQKIGERDGNREENLFEYIEKSFGRTLSSREYEVINTWNDDELTRYAVDQAKLSNALSIKYIEGILRAYQSNQITTVEQAKARDERFKSRKNKSQEEKSSIPSGYKVNEIYEENGVRFKFSEDGRRLIV